MRRLFIILLISSTLRGIAGSIEHPAMLHTQSDISHMKANLSNAPVAAAYSHLQTSPYAQSTYTNHTSELLDGYLKRMDQNNWGPSGSHGQYADYNNYTAAMYDAAAAYQLALRYQLSEDTQYATAAVGILNAWAANCNGVLKLSGYTNDIPDPNQYLLLIQAYQFANAAELLRDYDGWASVDFTIFQNWMRTTYYDLANLFLTNHHGGVGNMHYWLNWDLAAMTAVLSVGILCDDQTLIDQAINYYKGTQVTTALHTSAEETGYIRNAVPYLHNDPDSGEELGQCEESGRDQGHATLCVALLGAFCQMALNVGEDLFAYDDYRALKMAEYVGKYNLPTAATYSSGSKSFVYASVPYTSYTNPSYTNETVSSGSRGTIRPCWEIFAAYARSHMQSARYCEEWVTLMRAQSGFGSDGGAGDYGTNSGGFDQLGYGTLMYGWKRQTYTQEIGFAGAATLILPFDATIPAGVKAYTLTYSGGETVTASEILSGTLSANTPVLLNAEAGKYQFINTTTAIAAGSGTHITGALTGVYEETTPGLGHYILTNHTGGVGFRRTVASSKVASFRAYLTASGSSRDILEIDFGGTTGLSEVKGLMDDGKKEYYDLMGRRAQNPGKGIYIVNGKKVILIY